MLVMIELFGTTTGLTVSLSSIQIQTESGNVLEILNHDSFAKIAELSLFFCGFYLRSTTRSAEMGFPWRLISDILPGSQFLLLKIIHLLSYSYIQCCGAALVNISFGFGSAEP
jgi:hypothetical protein